MNILPPFGVVIVFRLSLSLSCRFRHRPAPSIVFRSCVCVRSVVPGACLLPQPLSGYFDRFPALLAALSIVWLGWPCLSGPSPDVWLAGLVGPDVFWSRVRSVRLCGRLLGPFVPSYCVLCLFGHLCLPSLTSIRILYPSPFHLKSHSTPPYNFLNFIIPLPLLL